MNEISFDAAMQRIFGAYLDKNDILEEVKYLMGRLNPETEKDHLAVLETIKLAMLEKL